jgi:hypothetical protein
VKPIQWRQAIRDSDLDGTAKHVAHVLSTYMNDVGDTFVGKATIARGASLKSVRAVDYAISRLVDRGFLNVQLSKGRHPNHFIASTPHGDAGSNPASDDSQPRISRPPTSHGDAPEVGRTEIETEVGLRGRVIEDDCMRCLLRKPLFGYRRQLLCRGCVVEVTGELEADLRAHVEGLQ